MRETDKRRGIHEVAFVRQVPDPTISAVRRQGVCRRPSAAIEFDQRKQRKKEFAPSRLFIYYNERVIEGTVSQDAGAQIRDGIKSVAKLGAPPESDWPYDISKFAQRPPKKAYGDAKQDLVSSYSRLEMLELGFDDPAAPQV